MVVKINVSIPKEILDRLDEAAREANSSRSALLSQVIKSYLEEKEAQKQLQYRREAAKKIDRVREQYGPWDGTAEVLKWREMH